MKWDIARQRQTRTTGRRTATLRVRLMVGAAFERTNSSRRDRVADKTKEFATCCRPFALPGFLQRLSRIETAQVYQLECAFDFISLLPGKPGATKSNRIQPKNVVALGRNNERRNIFAEGGAALRDHQAADAHILMENATATEKGVVVHHHITAQQHIVRDDHLVADNAVVSDMRVGHEKIFIPDLGRAVCSCSTMNGRLLANDVAFADFYPAWRSRRKTNVLRLTSDDCAVPDSIAPADGYFPFNHDISADHAIVSDGNGAANKAVRTDLNVRANL